MNDNLKKCRLEITEFSHYDKVPLKVLPHQGPLDAFIVRHAGHSVDIWREELEEGAMCTDCGASFSYATTLRGKENS